MYEISNLKCKVIHAICYTQTLQLCTYNFKLGNPFLVLVDRAMKTQLMHLPFPFLFIVFLTIANLVKKT